MSPRGLRLGLFAAGVRLAEGLPAPLLYRLARVVAHLLSALPTPPRRRLRQNLAVVLGVPPASPLLRPFVQGAYRTQVANYVDLLRARRITPDEVTSRVAPPGEPTAGPSHAASVADEASVANRDRGDRDQDQDQDQEDGWPAFQSALAAGRGLVLVTAHFGRFEMMSHALAQRGVRLTLPVERLQPPALFELVCQLRQRPGFTVVAADLGLRPWLRALQRGDVVALFADWDATGTGVPVRFCDAVALLPPGPALLTLRTGVPLFAGFALPDGPRGRIRPVFEPLVFEPLVFERALAHVERPGDVDQDREQDEHGSRHVGAANQDEAAAADAGVKRITQRIATALERYVRRYPDQWVMFHRVWPEQTSTMPVL